jgi:serine/threonine protein kinase
MPRRLRGLTTRRKGKKQRKTRKQRGGGPPPGLPPGLRIGATPPSDSNIINPDFTKNEAQEYYDSLDNPHTTLIDYESVKGDLKGKKLLIKIIHKLMVNTASCNALKKLFGTPEAMKESTLYLSPVLAQYTLHDSTVIQLLEKEGNDLNFLYNNHHDILIKNSKTIINSFNEILEFLNRKHLLHRDIKPENIVWTGERAKLIDLSDIVPGPKYETQKGTFGTDAYLPKPFNGVFNHEVNVYAMTETERALGLIDVQ